MLLGNLQEHSFGELIVVRGNLGKSSKKERIAIVYGPNL